MESITASAEHRLQLHLQHRAPRLLDDFAVMAPSSALHHTINILETQDLRLNEPFVAAAVSKITQRILIQLIFDHRWHAVAVDSR